MTSTLPYRPSDDTDTLSGSGATSNRAKPSGLPRLTPSPSVLNRSPSSQTLLRRPSENVYANTVAIPQSSRPRRCKSQYPLDSSERHVEFILVASFHIDRGPIMEHQYPAAISGDESMLAELMLPDQTHVRSQDWTIFFLHKDTSADDDDESLHEKKKRRNKANKSDNGEDYGSDDGSADESSDDENGGGEGPPLMYVLNLVNTKQDNTVKRYALPGYRF
jgi:hypothetical protein